MDNDFEFEIDSDSEYSESSSDVSSEEIEEVIEAPRKGCITKGGKTATASWPVKSQKEICELELESTRKEQDLTPVVQTKGSFSRYLLSWKFFWVTFHTNKELMMQSCCGKDNCVQAIYPKQAFKVCYKVLQFVWSYRMHGELLNILEKRKSLWRRKSTYPRTWNSASVEPKLVSELYHKGCHVCMDNWYTSEKLFEHLEANGTVACGPARKCQLPVPASLQIQKLERDEPAYRQDGSMLMMKYQDKKSISFHSFIKLILNQQEKRKAKLML